MFLLGTAFSAAVLAGSSVQAVDLSALSLVEGTGYTNVTLNVTSSAADSGATITVRDGAGTTLKTIENVSLASGANAIAVDLPSTAVGKVCTFAVTPSEGAALASSYVNAGWQTNFFFSADATVNPAVYENGAWDPAAMPGIAGGAFKIEGEPAVFGVTDVSRRDANHNIVDLKWMANIDSFYLLEDVTNDVTDATGAIGALSLVSNETQNTATWMVLTNGTGWAAATGALPELANYTLRMEVDYNTNPAKIRYSVKKSGDADWSVLSVEGDTWVEAKKDAATVADVCFAGKTSIAQFGATLSTKALVTVNETEYADVQAALAAAGGKPVVLFTNIAFDPTGTAAGTFTIAENGKSFAVVNPTAFAAPATKGAQATYADNTLTVTSENLVAEVNNGTFGTDGNPRFLTLDAAIAAAVAGKTVALVKDVDLAAKLSVNKNITLDLNDQKLTMADYVSGSDVMALDVGTATVTVKGGTISGTKLALVSGTGAADATFTNVTFTTSICAYESGNSGVGKFVGENLRFFDCTWDYSQAVSGVNAMQVQVQGAKGVFIVEGCTFKDVNGQAVSVAKSGANSVHYIKGNHFLNSNNNEGRPFIQVTAINRLYIEGNDFANNSVGDTFAFHSSYGACGGPVVFQSNTVASTVKYLSAAESGATPVVLFGANTIDPAVDKVNGRYKTESVNPYSYVETLADYPADVTYTTWPDGTVYADDVALTTLADLTRGDTFLVKPGDPDTPTDVAEGLKIANGAKANEKVLKNLYLAKIGETKYESLGAAAEHATAGATIVMLDDDEAAMATNELANVTVDLAGFTLTAGANDKPIILVKGSSATLSLVDNGVTKGRLTGANPAVEAAAGGKVTLNGVTLTGNTVAARATGANSKVTVSGGWFTNAFEAVDGGAIDVTGGNFDGATFTGSNIAATGGRFTQTKENAPLSAATGYQFVGFGVPPVVSGVTFNSEVAAKIVPPGGGEPVATSVWVAKDGSGEPEGTVQLPDSFVSDATGKKTGSAAQEDLNTAAGYQSGATMKKWHCYVLGMPASAATTATTEGPYIAGAQDSDTSNIGFRFATAAMVKAAESGCKVEYQVEAYDSPACTGTPAATSERVNYDATAKIANPSGGAKYYKMKVFITPKK